MYSLTEVRKRVGNVWNGLTINTQIDLGSLPGLISRRAQRSNWAPNTLFRCWRLQWLEKADSEGLMTLPLKFWADAYVWVHSPYIAISTISRGGVKVNISYYMTKLDFWPWSPVEKNDLRSPGCLQQHWNNSECILTMKNCKLLVISSCTNENVA